MTDETLSLPNDTKTLQEMVLVRISVCPTGCSGIVRPSDFLFLTLHFLTYFSRFYHTFFPLRFTA